MLSTRVAMLDSQQVGKSYGSFSQLMCLQIQTIRATLRSVFEQCNVPYKVAPFDHDLYEECTDEAFRRGYPLEGASSVRTFLLEGVTYAATATQIWIALYTACLFYIDDIPFRFPSDIHDVYLFNERFFGKRKQANTVLNALADVILQATDLCQPIAAKLIMTSTLNFITSNLLEYEARSMQVCL